MKNNRQTLNDEIIGSQQQTQTGKSHDQRCIKNVLCACDGFIVRSSHAQFLFMSLDVFFLGGSIIRLQRFFFVTCFALQFSIGVIRWTVFLKLFSASPWCGKVLRFFSYALHRHLFHLILIVIIVMVVLSGMQKCRQKQKTRSTSLPKMCYLYGIDMQ